MQSGGVRIFETAVAGVELRTRVHLAVFNVNLTMRGLTLSVSWRPLPTLLLNKV